MEIVHVSAECYPFAKAGGLGDVVGALPKYLQLAGNFAKVVCPMYRTKYLFQKKWEVVHKGNTNMGPWFFDYTIIKESSNELGFDLYLVDINGLLDREKIYGYEDDPERFTAFQIAVLDWISSWSHQPDVIHAHDHHTGLIPFMMKYCYRYKRLSNIKTVFTIHNAEYQGSMSWQKSIYLPEWNTWHWGMLDWNNAINPLAAAVKCADSVTTVSPNYMRELQMHANGLETLFQQESAKCVGILNGIDTKVWNPETDQYLDKHYSVKTVTAGKQYHKKQLCERFGLDVEKPLFVFIGRLVGEKGAEIIPSAIADAFQYIGRKMNFLILGSGSSETEAALVSLKNIAVNDYNVFIGYNEALSHLMYAGADFLMMPSRVEPCGLNQMYALRYGTMPMVRRTGGLQDTVIDVGDEGGFGICFNEVSKGDLTHAIYRAGLIYQDTKKMANYQKKMMKIDHSWESSIQQYMRIYQ